MTEFLDLLRFFFCNRAQSTVGMEPMSKPGDAMVREQLIPRGITDPRVIETMTTLDRRIFVASRFWNEAFEDRPLPTDYGQTISQPYIVAAMTQYLELEPHHRVLEIGTGSGYQAAVLAKLCREVITIERIAALSVRAEEAVRQAGIDNIKFIIGDGTRGWPEQAPYDRIIVTAAARKTTPELLNQLADGGIMVGPEGPPHLDLDQKEAQTLRRWRRRGNEFTVEDLFDVRFVPLINESDDTVGRH